ncbi:MAG TPA: carboxypeptidase-like regulatory domain-containing protein [Hymenobacter sp.]|uniref:carboxypeptidase-like regulatory domain-containing protein n=1 Tax=Hymenobacter sp. TaxID=1898978 RepID=UPI002D801805|nr:carboxypeptidase-like regulatory domain-containing protein [Hymenobacter sp.]HET9503118.1 carboxypeptidase-like regulatory domain-containing protein [Hymenobacter sp.]
MKIQAQKLVWGLLAAGLLGAGTTAAAAHPPVRVRASVAGERPAQVPGRRAAVRPAPGPVALVTARLPGARPTAPAPEAAPALAMSAVNRRIQAGRIIDEAGQPLVGATVLLKGTTRGTSTDANGDYALPVPLGLNTFVVAHTGYQEEVAQSRDGQPLTVTLLPVPGQAHATPEQPAPRQRLRKAPR